MITNRVVLEGLLDELASRSDDIADWEASRGLQKGEIRKALLPLNEHAINRNIKLIAMHLEIPAQEFFRNLELRTQRGER